VWGVSVGCGGGPAQPPVAVPRVTLAQGMLPGATNCDAANLCIRREATTTTIHTVTSFWKASVTVGFPSEADSFLAFLPAFFDF